MGTTGTRPQLRIRPVQESDSAAVREIFNEAVEDGLATFGATIRSGEMQKQQILATGRDLRYPMLVAEIRGWVCGWTAIEPHDERRGLDDIAEVTIFVRRSFRSYGVGRQLMRATQAEAARLGYRKLIGRVLADNSDSLRLCQATGWRVVGTHQAHARQGTKLLDVTIVEFTVSAGSIPSSGPSK